MTPPEESNKHEIVVSKETKNLARFSSTNLIIRGQKLADLVLFKSPLLEKVNNILLGEFSRIGDNKNKSMLYQKIRLAIALLEAQNKSLENWAIDILYEELEKPENPEHIFPQKNKTQQEYLWRLETQEYEDSILHQKSELLQLLFKVGKQKIASEYALEKTRKSWDCKGFPILFKDNLNIFSDKQMGDVVKILSKADKVGKHLSIDELLKYNHRQRDITVYFQGLSENHTDPSLRILACEALINLEQPDAAKKALMLISSGSDYFAEFAKFLLGLTIRKQEIEQSATLLLDIIQKETNTYWLYKYITYLPKVEKKGLAAATLLDQLFLPGYDDKKNAWKYVERINELVKISYWEQDFLDRLIYLATNAKTDFALRRRSFQAIHEFDGINQTQTEQLLGLLESKDIDLFKIYTASALANFPSTEDLGTDLLIRFIEDKSIVKWGVIIEKVILQNRRLTFNSKFLKALYDLPSKHWGIELCLVVIKILKKAEQ